MVEAFKKDGVSAYRQKWVGRPKMRINSVFVDKVIAIRKSDDYGSEKIHFVLKEQGFAVSQHIIQRILDENKLTEPCEKRRGQRKYVRYQWPLSNYMWHSDWTQYKGKWYCAFIDDRSRRIQAIAEFENATEEHTSFVFYEAMLTNEVCPVIVLSDKGTQFYVNKKTKNGIRPISTFEQQLNLFGIELWTSRRNHPQTNGKMEKWFDTMKKRKKKHPDETLQEFVVWYNTKRIHHALQYRTPDVVYHENV